jgi:oxygen-independent coproporphyrinogen-3 oxidase
MPWCVRKCPYCDFNSHQLKSARPDGAYIDALLADLASELPRIEGRRIESVFFGGGTPSLFPPEAIARFLAGARAQVAFADDVEITLEANPGTIERGRFQGYAAVGINRVSLGAQSFNADALAALGRIHSVEETLRAVEELRAAGLDNFNLDLMYALPGQTVPEALLDLKQACALEPAHLSYYQLTLEPGTVFHAKPPALPDEDAAWDMQQEGQALLDSEGYAQYEVSAYARGARRCRHNLNYWLFGDYLGIGAGAHGKVSLKLPHQIVRTLKPKQPGDYQRLAALGSVGESSTVAEEQLPFEFMLNALRLNEGFSEACYEARTGLAFEAQSERFAGLMKRGLVEKERQEWRATTLGRRFLNDLQAAFLA